MYRKVDQMQQEENKKVKVVLIDGDTNIEFEYKPTISLLEAINKQGVYLAATCGQRGTCGKCKVLLVKGELSISDSDQKKFTEQELSLGYRLACKAYPKENCTIRIAGETDADFKVITDNTVYQTMQSIDQEEGYAVAIDIGTTTIVMSLIGLSSKKIQGTFSSINRQRAYGADVVSRIKASNEGKGQKLRESIQKDLLAGLKALLEKAGVKKTLLKRIVIAANTTMVHLLLGYSCEALGSFPFTPVQTDTLHSDFQEVFNANDWQAEVTILPGFSAFVGSDITAGLYACDFDEKQKINLFIDLGTNGEMAIGNKDRILVSSTAAGPAFEGGNILCGVGSVAGAICKVELRGDLPELETIGSKTPIGICGTGVVEITAELLRIGLIDATGLFVDEYFEEGYELSRDLQKQSIRFTQKDIREIQLAKAAVRAGIEILMHRYGCRYEEIECLYLAGGFGYQLNLEKAIRIGLLPKELHGRMKAIGNSALAGAVKYLLEEDADSRLSFMKEITGEIHLSNDEEFNDLYLQEMYFPNN
ncbi:MAG: ASKHA domain-containing protein [Mobilitalea sp.]